MNPPSFRTKREIALASLRAGIQSGRYPPGQVLRQAQLARELGLGATPVREAVLELVARGLLVQESHHSVRVAEFDLPRIRAIYRTRMLLEAEAARLGTLEAGDADREALAAALARMERAGAQQDREAAGAADGEFHRRLYAAGGNEVLLGLIEQLWDSFPRYLLWNLPGRIEASLGEHRAILDAVLARAPELAAAAVTRHLASGLGALERYLADFPAGHRPQD